MAGEVGIDTSKVPGDPEATIEKMERVKAAALAPASPSSQDLRVAASATAAKVKATAELMRIDADQRAASRSEQSGNPPEYAAEQYARAKSDSHQPGTMIRLAV